jgi:hypothetical protein
MLFSTRSPVVRSAQPGATTPAAVDARRLIQPLIARAGELDPADGVAWERLRSETTPVLDDLVARGRLPQRVLLRDGAAPASVAAALLAAWSAATEAWPDRHHRR